MKTSQANPKRNGLTLIELLVVVAAIAVLAAMLLPVYNSPRRGYRIVCMNNLKQIDLGFAMYASDHSNQYPMQISAANSGSVEQAHRDQVFPHFEKLKKYIQGGQFYKLCVCPSDKTRKAGSNDTTFTDLNISYFLNLNVAYTNSNPAQAILLGDRNISLNRQPVKAGLLIVTTNVDLNWTDEIHPKGGNLAFVDGHVEWSKVNTLNSLIEHQPVTTNHFCVP